jgi:hypothetical protein
MGARMNCYPHHHLTPQERARIYRVLAREAISSARFGGTRESVASYRHYLAAARHYANKARLALKGAA